MDKIFDRVPLDVWPVEYGGNGGTIEEISECWIEIIKQSKTFLECDANFGKRKTQSTERSKQVDRLLTMDIDFTFQCSSATMEIEHDELKKIEKE